MKFFLLYLLFFYITNQFFIDSESGVTICNQFRRLDTWRHRARNHSTRQSHYLLIGDHFGTKPLSSAVFEILASKCIGVKTFWPLRVAWRHG